MYRLRTSRRELLILRQRLSHRRVWRLSWLGKVARNEDVWTDSTIEVAYTPIHADAVTAAIRAGEFELDHEATVIVPVAIGLLPRMIVGSIWARGKLRILPQYARERFVVNGAQEVNYTSDWARIWDTKTGVRGEPVLPFSLVSLPTGRRGNGLGARLLSLTTESGGSRLLIPCVEIARFFLATSTEMATLLFSNLSTGSAVEDHPQYAGVRHINEMYDPAESSWEEETGEVVLRLRRGMRNSDAKIIAWIYRSDRARNEFRSVRPRLEGTKVERKVPAIRVSLPVDGPVELEVEGHSVTGQICGRRIVYFVVTRIVSCDMRFPFNRVTFDTEGQGTLLTDEDAAAPAPQPESGEERGPRSQRRKPVRQDRTPESSLGRDREHDLDRRFPQLEHIPSAKMVERNRVALNRTRRLLGDREEEPVATPSGTDERTGVRGHSINVVTSTGPVYVPPRTPTVEIANYEVFAKALDLLRRSTSLEVHTRSITEFGPGDERYGSSAVPGDATYSGGGRTRRGVEQIVIAEVVDAGCHFYFLEPNYPAPRNEWGRFLSVASITLRRLSDQDLVELLRLGGRLAGAWPITSPRDDLLWHPSNHPEASPVADFAERWAHALLERKRDLERKHRKRQQGLGEAATRRITAPAAQPETGVA